MPNRKQSGHMWGCLIVWDSGGKDWMWESATMGGDGSTYFPLVFTETRKAIMPLVKEMRALSHIKSAKAVKVPIPEIPE